MNIDWNFAIAVVIMGLLVVFMVLILLVLLCTVMGKIFSSMDQKKGDKKPKEVELKKESVKIKPMQEKKSNNAVNGDIVAVITAAIAAIMADEGNRQPFVIKKIKRAKETRPAWNAAGISENTRPF